MDPKIAAALAALRSYRAAAKAFYRGGIGRAHALASLHEGWERVKDTFRELPSTSRATYGDSLSSYCDSNDIVPLREILAEG